MLSKRQLMQGFGRAAMILGAGDLWPTLAASAESVGHHPDLAPDSPAGSRPEAKAISGYASLYRGTP